MTDRQIEIFMQTLEVIQETSDYNRTLTEECPESLKLLSDSNLKLMTYNINNATGAKAESNEDFIAKKKADVISLQEISKHYKP
ncbi:hypothetical protein DSO57_1029002 [Entomophthora muscae]|uniref:Uncharacterized protein n=1 Tax=Entomophthora muscae TaxID=34485 RepID=A0ACC2TCQ4_9FUNG|nr:hypothetical protein DSO57_1029002 [Entomophthora muscae]